ncbi:LPXTG cell wall anchor domain-containing protein, partial [Enterococcus hirae]|nr:LPXTG cell wall anchor domain-containing protein [Enterococcus hirae]EMF0396323.1 LPXTG cell wall anchor domain-containing protein [Enterococcus hirae]
LMRKKRIIRWIVSLFISISCVGLSSPIFADDYQTTTVSVNFIRKIMPESLPGNPTNSDVNKNKSDKKIEIAKQLPKTNDSLNILTPLLGIMFVSFCFFYIVLSKRRNLDEKYT